jgi:hypothetical protein
MQTTITITDDLLNAAQQQAKVFHRSVDGQLNYWLKIGKIAEANPDLPFEFIKNALVTREEMLNGGVKPYE